jgi:mannose/fructose/N-acetylgalactosamine-specific phosphotransferase system component IID
MADIDHVHPHVTTAVTQDALAVIGEAPAMAIGSLFQTIGYSVGTAAINNVHNQLQANMVHETASTVGVEHLLDLI